MLKCRGKLSWVHVVVVGRVWGVLPVLLHAFATCRVGAALTCMVVSSTQAIQPTAVGLA